MHTLTLSTTMRILYFCKVILITKGTEYARPTPSCMALFGWLRAVVMVTQISWRGSRSVTWQAAPCEEEAGWGLSGHPAADGEGLQSCSKEGVSMDFSQSYNCSFHSTSLTITRFRRIGWQRQENVRASIWQEGVHYDSERSDGRQPLVIVASYVGYQMCLVSAHITDYPLYWPDTLVAAQTIKRLQKWKAVGRRWDHSSQWACRYMHIGFH